MKIRQVIKWLNKNYPDIKIITKGNRTDTKVLKLADNREVKINFNMHTEGFGCIITDDQEKPLVGKYNAVVVLFNYKKDIDNIATLLHEVGHYITPQEEGAALQNEINAWEGAFKLSEKLGLPVTRKVKGFANICLNSYIKTYGLSEDHRKALIELGLRKNRKSCDHKENKPFYVKDVLSKNNFKNIHNVS